MWCVDEGNYSDCMAKLLVVECGSQCILFATASLTPSNESRLTIYVGLPALLELRDFLRLSKFYFYYVAVPLPRGVVDETGSFISLMCKFFVSFFRFFSLRAS